MIQNEGRVVITNIGRRKKIRVYLKTTDNTSSKNINNIDNTRNYKMSNLQYSIGLQGIERTFIFCFELKYKYFVY